MTILRVSATALFLLAACGARDTGEALPAHKAGDVSAPELRLKGAELPDFFDCLREEGATVIAAHRGGPRPGYPENALETLKKTFADDTPVLEVDISESRDGVLFLFHDRSLSRLTGTQGFVADTDWAQLSELTLLDNDGNPTAFTPVTLSEALRWAVEVGALLELDKKENTSFRNIIAEVREAGAEKNVLLITYSNEQAAEVARLAPDLMMTAGAEGVRDLDALERAGVDLDMVVAWTGTRSPDFDANAAMAGQGVEAAFGTLGRPGERLDDRYGTQDYRALVSGGVRLIATDNPQRIADMLTEDDLAFATCAGNQG